MTPSLHSSTVSRSGNAEMRAQIALPNPHCLQNTTGALDQRQKTYTRIMHMRGECVRLFFGDAVTGIHGGTGTIEVTGNPCTIQHILDATHGSVITLHHWDENVIRESAAHEAHALPS